MFGLLDFDPQDPSFWLVPGIGLAGALISFWLGAAWMRRQVGQQAAPPVAREADPLEDPFLHGGKMDRRSSIRRKGHSISILISDVQVQAEPHPGWVVDRSTGGLCLVVSDPVEPGVVLSVRAANAPTTVPWVQIEVKSCRQVDRDWELGCRFLRTPPWSTLLLFG